MAVCKGLKIPSTRPIVFSKIPGRKIWWKVASFTKTLKNSPVRRIHTGNNENPSMKGTTMKKKTWKSIAITAIGTTVASVVLILKLADELELAKSAIESHNDMLKEMADRDEIQNLTIGGERYEPNL
jgi:hypothetical protein